MQDLMQLNEKQFKQLLEDNTTPQAVLDNASTIYSFMGDIFGQNVLDSLLREWAFQWSTDKLGIEYDTIYNKWLNGFCL